MNYLSRVGKHIKKDYGEIAKDLKFNLSWLANRTLTSEVLTISLTKKCNLNCTYCWDYDNRPKIEEMSTEVIKKILDDAAKMGIETFNPFGGEPFIRKDMFEILEYGFAKGMKVTLTTNGTLISDERVRDLVAISPNFKLIVLTSLDGVNAQENDFIRSPGSFDKTTRFIRLLNEERIRQNKTVFMVINNVVSRNNFRSMVKMTELARELGADSVNYITPIVSSTEVKRGMVERRLFVEPEEFDDLDAMIDAVLKIRSEKSCILNNYESLKNFKQYYKRQYQQHESIIRQANKKIDLPAQA